MLPPGASDEPAFKPGRMLGTIAGMSSDAAEDFDPTRALDGWRAVQEEGLPELDLGAVLGRARRAADLDPERVARLRRRGFGMQDIEDLEMQPVKPAAESALPEAPQAPAAPSPRLLSQWQADGWSAGLRRVLGSHSELRRGEQGPRVEMHAPQWLLAAWPPAPAGAPHLPRWPQHAVLVAADDMHGAAEQLLAHLPPEALLWLGELDLDWALVADVVLLHDPTLQPFQSKALKDFSAAERLAQFKRVAAAYEAAAPGQLLRHKRPEC